MEGAGDAQKRRLRNNSRLIFWKKLFLPGVRSVKG